MGRAAQGALPVWSWALALTVWLAGCGGGQQPAPGAAAGRPPGAAPPSVTVAVAQQQPVPVEIDAIGSAQPYRTVQIKSMVDGQISKVLLRQGQDVHAGDLLFQLDRRPFQAALDQALGKLAQDKATAAYNQAQAQRDQTLEKWGVIAPQASQQQQAQAQAGNAAVQADQAAVETARVNLGYTDIRAPIDARAGAILVNLGNLVRSNDTNPLVTLNQVTPIYVQFNVPEAQMEAVRAAGVGRLAVQAFPPNDSQTARGTLTFMDNSVDAATGTIRLMATFSNRDRRLWPGEFLNVHLLLGTNRHAVVVPESALQTGQQGKYVYVVEPDGTAVARNVTSPQSYRQLAVITSGVQPGERVIVAGQIKVIPNSKVQVANVAPVSPNPGPAAAASGAGDPPGESQ